MELRQSPDYARYMRSIGWQVEESDQQVLAYVKRIFPFMSVMKIQRASVKNIEPAWVKRVAQKHEVWGCYIEPLETETEFTHELKKAWNTLSKSLRMTTTKNAMLPTATRQLDLKKNENELLAGMKEKTRYNVGLAQRRGLHTAMLSAKTVSDSPLLFTSVANLIEANAKRANYWGVPKNWLKAQLNAFGDKGVVMIVTDANGASELEKTPEVTDPNRWQTVACYWLTDDGIYYGPNGSTALGRKNMAPTLAVVEGMRLGKQKKKKYLDFDGIYDERAPNKRWLGYSRFKAGFGGYEVKYGLSGYSWFPCW